MSGSSFSGKVAGARRALGDYSAIVKKQETDVWAEDEYGKTIAEGEAGVDDADVIQKSENYTAKLGGGIVRLGRGKFRIGSGTWIIRSNVELVGSGKDKTILEIYYDKIINVQVDAGVYLRGLIKNYNDNSNGDSRWSIRDMTFQVDNESFEAVGQSARAIHFVNCKDVLLERVRFKTLLRPLAGVNESGALFFWGYNVGDSANITVRDCEFYNGVTLPGDNIDTIFKLQKVRNGKIINCYSDGENADGSIASYGHNYNISGCIDVEIINSYSRKGHTGIWIEQAGSITLNKLKVINTNIEECDAGIGISNGLSSDSEILCAFCKVRNVNSYGINDSIGVALIIGCEVYEHALNAATAGIQGRDIIGCKVISVTNENQIGISPLRKAIGCTIKTYHFAVDVYNVDNILLAENDFLRAVDWTTNWASGCVQARYSNYWGIINNYFEDAILRIVYDGTNGKGHIIRGNIFNNQNITSDAIVWGDTVPVELVIEYNDFRRSGGVDSNIVTEASNKIKGNNGYPTENSDTATITADGTTTTFYIPHGLIAAPSFVSITPKAGAPKPSEVDWDDTNIILTFATAPAEGTYYYAWEARV